MNAQDIIDFLDLAPLPWEGGWYRETWRAGIEIPNSVLGAGYVGARNAGTAIYYLLTPDTVSKMHRLPSSETFHFYLGDPVEMLLLNPDGSSEIVNYGPRIMDGERVQYTVPGNVWMGARLKPQEVSEGYALMGTTVAPGFDFDDLEMGEPATLQKNWPEVSLLISELS